MKNSTKSFFLAFFIFELFLAYFHLASQERALPQSVSSPSSVFLWQGGVLFSQGIKTKKIIPALLTAYSSDYEQTDETPFITAANTLVRDGIVANNILPFGTKIKFPEIFGDKIFVVEDRMHYRKDNNQFDIWMEDPQKALNFGFKITYGEILE